MYNVLYGNGVNILTGKMQIFYELGESRIFQNDMACFHPNARSNERSREN
jgi:hypothetical protein